MPKHKRAASVAENKPKQAKRPRAAAANRAANTNTSAAEKPWRAVRQVPNDPWPGRATWAHTQATLGRRFVIGLVFPQISKCTQTNTLQHREDRGREAVRLKVQFSACFFLLPGPSISIASLALESCETGKTIDETPISLLSSLRTPLTPPRPAPCAP